MKSINDISWIWWQWKKQSRLLKNGNRLLLCCVTSSFVYFRGGLAFQFDDVRTFCIWVFFLVIEQNITLLYITNRAVTRGCNICVSSTLFFLLFGNVTFCFECFHVPRWCRSKYVKWLCSHSTKKYILRNRFVVNIIKSVRGLWQRETMQYIYIFFHLSFVHKWYWWISADLLGGLHNVHIQRRSIYTYIIKVFISLEITTRGCKFCFVYRHEPVSCVFVLLQ